MAQNFLSGISGISLRDYWFVIRRRKWYLILTFAAIFSVVMFINRMQTPLYRASSAIKIVETRTLAGLFIMDKFFWTPGDLMASYALAIRGQNVLERVASELNFVTRDASQDRINAAVNALYVQISAQVLANTNIISIDVLDGDPKRAAAIANKVAQVFVEENLNERNKQARASREFIENQLLEVKNNLRKAEDELKELVKSGGVVGTAVAVQNQILSLEAQETDLLRVYTENHPDVVKIGEHIETLKEQLKNLPERELTYARLKREVDVHEKLYLTLKERLEEARIAEAGKTSDVTVLRLAEIPRIPIRPNRQANMLVAVISALVVSGAFVFIVENIDTSITTMEDVETYLKLPVFGVIPFLKIDLPAALVKTKTKGLLFLKRRLPRVTKLRLQLLSNFSSRSSFVEAYKVLRTNLIVEGLNNVPKGKIVMLTSAGSEEGKSITVANLALSLAQEGLKTLLVDADLRRPVMHRVFGLHNRQPGLTNVLLGTTAIEDAVRDISDVLMGELEIDQTLAMQNIDFLKILTCGSSVHNPAEVLGLKELNALFEKLRNTFDIVLVDSPPILAVADGIILAPKADVVVLVYKVGRTSRNAIIRAKIQLESVKANVRGVVLNNISPEVELGSAYYYYHYKYYGEPEKGKSPEVRVRKRERE